MTIEINQKKLREELIYIYRCYVSGNEKLIMISKEKAKNLDGLWSGAFVLEKSIEMAIGGLRYLYLEPNLPTEKAKDILNELLK